MNFRYLKKYAAVNHFFIKKKQKNLQIQSIKIFINNCIIFFYWVKRWLKIHYLAAQGLKS